MTRALRKAIERREQARRAWRTAEKGYKHRRYRSFVRAVADQIRVELRGGRTMTRLALLLALALAAPAAHAHAWYGSKVSRHGIPCCNDKDCAPIPKSAVRIAAQGYVVTLGDAEFVVPFADAMVSEDEEYHGCVWGGSLRCFFAPPMGV